nr:sigma-70 family RNA polymerase sigma factor [Bacillus sp. UNC437CL72CviS29]
MRQTLCKGELIMQDERKLNINKIANEYLKTSDESRFNDLYINLKREYRNKVDYWSASTYLATRHDIEALFDDVILNVLKTLRESNGGDFVNLFSRSLKNMYISLLRKLRTRRKREFLYDDKTTDKDFIYSDTLVEGEWSFSNNPSDFDLEEHVTKKKEADQRELIDFLADPEQVNDETTTAIVETFITNDGPTTPTAIGKKLGLHHSTVIRKLERLAKRFDERQFGDYRDYLLA